MATIQQVRQQIAQQRQKITEARTRAQRFDPRIRQTQEQLRRATIETQAKIRGQIAERRKEKGKVLTGIEKESQKFETKAQKVERQLKQIERAQKAKSDYDSAYSAYRKSLDKYGVGVESASIRNRLSPEAQKIYSQLVRGAQKTQDRNIQKLENIKTIKEFNETYGTDIKNVTEYNEKIGQLQGLENLRKQSKILQTVDSKGNLTLNISDKSTSQDWAKIVSGETATPSNKFIPIKSMDIQGYYKSQGFDPKTNTYYNVVEKAKGLGETFKSMRDEKGSAVQTVVPFISELALKGKQKFENLLYNVAPSTKPFQYSSETNRLVQTVGKGTEIGQYFVPWVGGGLLVAGGAEKLSTGYGQESVKRMGESIESKYGVPSQLAWALPVVEIVGGGSLLFSQGKKLYEANKLRNLAKSPTEIQVSRLQSGNKGYDLIYGTRQSGKYSSETLIKQPFDVTKGGKGFVATEGYGQTIIYKGRKPIQIETFALGGRGSQIGTSGRYISTNFNPKMLLDQRKVTQYFKEITGAGGRYYYEPISSYNIKYGGGWTPEKGFSRDIYLTGSTKGGQPKTYLDFFSLSKVKGDTLSFIGGSPKGMIYNPLKDSYVLKAIPESKGLIKVFHLGKGTSSSSQGFINLGSGSTKTTLSSTFGGQAIQTATSQVVSNIPKSSTKGGIISGLVGGTSLFTQQETKIKTKQTTAQISDTATLEKLKTKQVTAQIPRPSQTTATSIRLNTLTAQLPSLNVKAIDESQQKLRQSPSQTTKQPQHFRQTSTPPLILPSPSSSLIKRLAKKVEQEPEAFKVFGRRFGKDLELGVFSTKKKAEKKLSKFLRGTLGRSGFIEKEGTKIKSNLLKNFMYRQSVKDDYRVVQKSVYSLSSYPEVKEIIYFKKKAEKKQKKPKKNQSSSSLGKIKNRKILKNNKLSMNPSQAVYGDQNIFFNANGKRKSSKELLLGFTDF